VVALLLEEHQHTRVTHAVGDNLDFLREKLLGLIIAREDGFVGGRWGVGFEPFEDEGGLVDGVAGVRDQDGEFLERVVELGLSSGVPRDFGLEVKGDAFLDERDADFVCVARRVWWRRPCGGIDSPNL
jgi:hypothetical protein